MNKKAVQWLYQELPNLVSNGVLQQDVAHKLREHYGEIKTVDKKWFIILLCSVVGALLIGLGIILLFGHNWEELSRPVRAFLSMLPLIAAQALALWVLLKHPASDALKESSATFLGIMVGASIALISQTYNIPGDITEFILYWMLLILPLAYLMEATIPAAIYVAGISSWACVFWNSPLQSILFWPLLALAVPHFIWSLHQERYTVRATILALIMAIGIYFGVAASLGKTWSGSWIVIHSSIITLFYLLGIWKFSNISTNWQRPFRVLGGIGIFIMTFILTFRFPWESVAGKYYHIEKAASLWASFPDNFITFILIAAAILMFLQYVKRKDLMGSLSGALPILALIGYALSASSLDFPVIMFNLFLLAISVIRIRVGIQYNNLGIINTGMFMLAALILARFFDSQVDFVIKGLVFIIIGIGFLATNVAILRRKGGVA